MMYLGLLAVPIALTSVATLVPASSALSMSNQNLDPHSPVHQFRQAAPISNESLDHYIEVGFINVDVGANITLQKFFGLDYTPSTCCDGDSSICSVRAGKTTAGKDFMACYGQGLATISDADVETMKCMINLHYLQPDKCIDIKGSICGKAYNGGLMRARKQDMPSSEHSDPKYQLSAEESLIIQAAAESMREANIDYTQGPAQGGTRGLEAILLTVVDGRNDRNSPTIDFDGHQGTDC